MKAETRMDQKTWPLVIGIDLGGTQLRIAVLRGSELLSRIVFSTGENSAPACVIPRIYQGIAQALNEANATLKQVKGIGIGVAGPLDSHTGVVFAPPNLAGWHHVPLLDIFKTHYDKPIIIENDANAAGLGEYMFGAGCGCTNLVYLTISTGIGGAVIIDGHILRGVSGTAGELGHMTIDWRGERCNCGNIGCLESIASGTAIARKANEAIARGTSFSVANSKEISRDSKNNIALLSDASGRQINSTVNVDAKAVAYAAEMGISAARDIIGDAAKGLGVGLVNIINIFNPEMIILGGGVMQMGPQFLESALQIVEGAALKVPASAVTILRAKLGIEVGLIGAGALIYSNEEEFKMRSSA